MFMLACSCVIWAWLFCSMYVACFCICVHVFVSASGHACVGHGAQVGLYGSMAPPAAQDAACCCVWLICSFSCEASGTRTRQWRTA